MVIVYSDVTGGRKHSYRGYTSTVHVLFRHHGHNIVVGRLAGGSGNTAPDDLLATFEEDYAPVSIACTGWWTVTCYLDSTTTNLNTWNNLVASGVSPVMLHIASDYAGDNISLSRSGFIGRSYLVYGAFSAYYVTLIAKA